MWHRHCGASRWGALCLALKWSKVIDEGRGSLGSRSVTADTLSSFLNISGLVNGFPRWNEGLKTSRMTRKSNVRATSNTDAEADNEHYHKGHAHDIVEDLMIDTGIDFESQTVSKLNDFAVSVNVQSESEVQRDILKAENKQEACDE